MLSLTTVAIILNTLSFIKAQASDDEITKKYISKSMRVNYDLEKCGKKLDIPESIIDKFEKPCYKEEIKDVASLVEDLAKKQYQICEKSSQLILKLCRKKNGKNISSIVNKKHSNICEVATSIKVKPGNKAASIWNKVFKGNDENESNPLCMSMCLNDKDFLPACELFVVFMEASVLGSKSRTLSNDTKTQPESLLGESDKKPHTNDTSKSVSRNNKTESIDDVEGKLKKNERQATNNVTINQSTKNIISSGTVDSKPKSDNATTLINDTKVNPIFQNYTKQHNKKKGAVLLDGASNVTSQQNISIIDPQKSGGDGKIKSKKTTTAAALKDDESLAKKSQLDDESAFKKGGKKTTTSEAFKLNSKKDDNMQPNSDDDIVAMKNSNTKRVKINNYQSEQPTKSHYLFYGIFGLVLCFTLYVAFQKRKKIMGLLFEGRKPSSRRQRNRNSRSSDIPYTALGTKEEKDHRVVF